MIVKGQENNPAPLTISLVLPYFLCFHIILILLFSFYPFALALLTCVLLLPSPSSHLHPYSSSSSLRSSSRFTFQSHSALPYTLPFLTLRFHLTSLLSDLLSTYICSPTSDLTPYPPYFPIVLHHLLTLQSHPIPSPNSKIRILLRRPPPTSVQLKL